MAGDNRTFGGAGASTQLNEFVNTDPYKVRIEWGTLVARTRRYTLTVTDRLGYPRPGSYLLAFIVSKLANGVPAGTQVLTVISGAQVAAITAGQVLLVRTTAAGVASIDLVADAADLDPRFVSVAPMQMEVSAAVTFA